MNSLFSLEGGFEVLLTNAWRIQIGPRWVNFNERKFQDVQWRVGVLGGHYFEVKPWLVFEDYLEGYFLAPQKSKGQFAGSGSVKLAWRVLASHHFILDALVPEIRGYRASNPQYAGRSYWAGNLGPRASYWWNISSNFEGSVSLYVAKSLLWAQNERTKTTDWFLLTVGATF